MPSITNLPPKHKRTFILTTSGGYHFYAGEVYDDLIESLFYPKKVHHVASRSFYRVRHLDRRNHFDARWLAQIGAQGPRDQAIGSGR